MKTEIKTLVGKIKEDYVKFATAHGEKELTGYHAEQVHNFEKNTTITDGRKYIKIVRENSTGGIYFFDIFFTIQITKIGASVLRMLWLLSTTC